MNTDPHYGVTQWVLAMLVFLLICVPALAQVHDPKALYADPAAANGPIAPLLTGLGEHHFEVTTNSPGSQQYFDQGYRLTMGFNHSEALRSFKEATRLDPNNAMAFWGWALALGPNLNLPMQENVVEQAYTAMQNAVALKDKVTAREQDYIEALATRYTSDPEAVRTDLDERHEKPRR